VRNVKEHVELTNEELIERYLASFDERKEPNDRLVEFGDVFEIILQGCEIIPDEQFIGFTGDV